MIVDAHTHLGLESFIVREIPEWKKRKPAFSVKMENSPERLLSLMDRSGVDRSVSFPFPLEEVDPTLANSYVVSAAREYPERIIPFVLIDEEPERWISAGAKGFKQHFLLAPERYPLSRVYRQVEASGFPLIAHFTTGKASVQAREILSAAPNIKLIFAHMGRQVPNTGEGVLDLLVEFKDFENIFFETSTVWDSEVICKAIDLVGSQRILFGSDFPFNSDPEDGSILNEIAIINASTNDPLSREHILGRNILGLLS